MSSRWLNTRNGDFIKKIRTSTHTVYSCIVHHFTLVDVEAGLDFGLHTCLRLNLVRWYHSDCTAVTTVWVANCERSNIWTKFVVVFVCGIHCSFYLYCCFRASLSKSVCICSRLTSVSLKVSTLLFVADFSLCTKVYCRKSCVLDLVRNPFVNLSSRFFCYFQMLIRTCMFCWPFLIVLPPLQCFDALGWVAGRASGL